MSCSPNVSNGAQNCEEYLTKVVASIIMKSGSEYTEAQLDSLGTMRTLISEETSATVVKYNGTDVTKGEVTSETTGFGTKLITGETTPTLIGYLKTGPCDFADALNSFDGGSYDVFNYDANGRLIGTRSGSKVKGLSAQVFAHATSPIAVDGYTQQFMIEINFQDEMEMRKPVAINVNYTLFDLWSLIPDGLKADYEVELTADTGSTKVSIRGGENTELTETLTAQLFKSNVTGVTIIPTYNAVTEVYDCVVTKTAGANLEYGEYATGRLVSKTGDIHDQVTNVIKFKGNA